MSKRERSVRLNGQSWTEATMERGSLRPSGVLVALMGALSLAACRDIPGPPARDQQMAAIWPGIVSDPVAVGSSAALALGGTAGTDVAYISLAPGAIPDGEVASIRNRVTGSGVVAVMVAGGLDPVPVSANAGDTLDIAVRLAGSDSTLHFVHAVAAARRPIVVRTDPPPRKRDVPLNAAMLVVFSEPIDPATLTGSAVQLRQGTTLVAGQLEFRDPANLTAAFVPAAPLAASTDYQLDVTQGIRDLDGEALEAPVTVEFTTASGPAPVASIIVDPPVLYLAAGDTFQLAATTLDSTGTEIIGHVLTWVSADTDVATVTQTGWVGARAVGGTTQITASADGQSGSAVINVMYPQIERFTVLSPIWTLAPGESFNLPVWAVDSAGDRIVPAVTWSSANPEIATVSTTGDVTGVSLGTTTVTAVALGMHDTVTVNVAGLAFRSVSAGHHHSCGVTADGAAYCWGQSQWGQLGIGRADERWIYPTPVAVVGGLRFASVSAGADYTCGVTTAGAAYCWGAAEGYGAAPGTEPCGVLGYPYNDRCSFTPVPLQGGLSFTTIAAGETHACGLTPGGAAYCWGTNWVGELGGGTTANHSEVPVPVSGGLAFISLSAGHHNSCGLTADGTAYCWGAGPNQVPGGVTFTSLSVGVHDEGACGLDTGGRGIFCWGEVNPPGFWLASGGLTFTAVELGAIAGSDWLISACGISLGGSTYCWLNAFFDPDTGPVVVPGAVPFATLSMGLYHRCGMSLDGIAYCWGGNNGIQPLGHGSFGDSAVPVRVAGQP